MNAYHRITLRTSQVGAFEYFIPLEPEGDGVSIFVDMVLPMVWVYSPKFFCAFSEMMTYLMNAPIDTLLPVPDYGPITVVSRKSTQ